MSNKNRLTAAIIFAVNMIFGLFYNTYFGWNWLPKTFLECVFDSITVVLLLLGFYFLSPLCRGNEPVDVKKS